MTYGTIGENRVSLPQSSRTSGLEAVRPLCHNEPYVRSRDCTSAPMSFGENLIFSLLSAYSPTLKANKGFIRPLNSDRNLHAKTTTLSLRKR
jgi:hypothetical protein